MDFILSNSSRADLSKIIDLDVNERVLVVKTLNGLPIILKYIAYKTTLNAITNFLLNVIKYNVKISDDKFININDCVISYKNKYITDRSKVLNHYGINSDYNEINITYKPSIKHFKYNLSDMSKSIKQISEKTEKLILKFGLIQLFVKQLTGTTTVLDISKENTIEEIKFLLYNKTGLHPNELRLIYSGESLLNQKKFKEYLCESTCKYYEFNIYCVLKLRGGMYHEFSGKDGSYGALQNIMERIYKVEPDL